MSKMQRGKLHVVVATNLTQYKNTLNIHEINISSHSTLAWARTNGEHNRARARTNGEHNRRQALTVNTTEGMD